MNTALLKLILIAEYYSSNTPACQKRKHNITQQTTFQTNKKNQHNVHIMGHACKKKKQMQ